MQSFLLRLPKAITWIATY